jgi:hypothetical protein
MWIVRLASTDIFPEIDIPGRQYPQQRQLEQGSI